MKEKPLDLIGIIIITVFLGLLTYASYLSYKSVDWTVLQRLEDTQLVLPTPIPQATSSALSKPPVETISPGSSKP